MKKILMVNKSFQLGGIQSSMINMANELSHDSDEVFSKDEILEFCNKANELIKEIKKVVFKEEL